MDCIALLKEINGTDKFHGFFMESPESDSNLFAGQIFFLNALLER